MMKNKKGRAQLLLLATLFALPVVVAIVLVNFWTPHNTVHHGTLLKPARTVPNIMMHDAAGEVRAFSNLAGQWVLTILKSASCDAQCQQAVQDNVYTAHHARITQGRHAHRVSVLFITKNGDDNNAQSSVHDNINVWYADAKQLTQLATIFSEPLSLHLIDPLGNVIMRFAPALGAEMIRKDVSRLLKYSTVRRSARVAHEQKTDRK